MSLNDDDMGAKDLSFDTIASEFDYMENIYKDMLSNNKYFYTNAYDLPNGDKVSITVEIDDYKRSWT